LFDTIANGSLYVDLRQLRGVFEVLLIMYTHEDTVRIHRFL
jgi:hypothetical protein